MRTRVFALGAAAALALSGCSLVGGDDDAGSSSSTSSGVVNGDASTNGAKAAGIDLDNPPKPMAELRLQINGDDVETTKVELLELRRKDNVMLATFRLTGDGRGTATSTGRCTTPPAPTTSAGTLRRSGNCWSRPAPG